MKTYCEIIASEFLPVVRALIAKTLIEKYKFTQKQVAEVLNISQPLVSFYLNGLRAKNFKKKINEKLLNKVDEICKQIVNGNISSKTLLIEILKTAEEIYSKEFEIIPCRHLK